MENDNKTEYFIKVVNEQRYLCDSRFSIAKYEKPQFSDHGISLNDKSAINIQNNLNCARLAGFDVPETQIVYREWAVISTGTIENDINDNILLYYRVMKSGIIPNRASPNARKLFNMVKYAPFLTKYIASWSYSEFQNITALKDDFYVSDCNIAFENVEGLTAAKLMLSAQPRHVYDLTACVDEVLSQNNR